MYSNYPLFFEMLSKYQNEMVQKDFLTLILHDKIFSLINAN